MTLTPAKETAAPEPKPDEVSITLDGVEMSVPKGTLIIRAAEELGIAIPRFCEHPLLDPVGACRQCIVEVEGQRKPITACTQPVAEGMVISTQLTSEVAEKAQAGTMELLLINHPLDCPVCDKGGECPLQNQAMANGREESRFRDVKRTYPKPLAVSEQILLDRERCVLCTRCTRFSQQVAGDPFIELFERSANEQVGTSPDEPFESYFSGNTVQICPVGALTSAAYRFRARPFDLVSTPSVCEHCASGCAQRTDWRRGKVTRRLAGDDPEVNSEWNCDKGRFAFSYATATERLTTPLLRDEHGVLQPASWTEAITVAAEGLREAAERGGVGVLPGGRLTFEDAYAYAKFARVVLETNDIDFRARPASAEEADFLAARVAGSALQVTYQSLEEAPAVLLVGFEPEEESPIVFLRLRKAAGAGGPRVFAIAPWETGGLRKMNGTLIQTVPGAEPRAMDALASGSGDAGAAGGIAQVGAVLREPGAVIMVGERLAAIPGALSAAARLASATGAQLAWVPRRAGERGAVLAGALPTMLPGEALVSDDAARDALAAAWEVPALPAEPGRTATEMLTAASDGELSALIVGGVDPLDMADPTATLHACDHAGFVVSLELLPSAVTEYADVVFPVAAAAEKAGTYYNWEGRARPFGKTLPEAGTLTDAEVLAALAEELDAELGFRDVAGARAEWQQVAAVLESWPQPAEQQPDPAVLGQDRPLPEAGQAILASWHQLLDAGALQRNEPHLAGTAQAPVARISAATAAEVGVAEDAPLTVASELGELTLPVAITAMPDRVVWLPTNAPGYPVRSTLGVDAGAVVALMPGKGVE